MLTSDEICYRADHIAQNPGDWDMTPENRGVRMLADVAALHETTGDMSWESDIADALTDLRHACDVTGLDFNDLLRKSFGHYMAERQGCAQVAS